MSHSIHHIAGQIFTSDHQMDYWQSLLVHKLKVEPPNQVDNLGNTPLEHLRLILSDRYIVARRAHMVEQLVLVGNDPLNYNETFAKLAKHANTDQQVSYLSALTGALIRHEKSGKPLLRDAAGNSPLHILVNAMAPEKLLEFLKEDWTAMGAMPHHWFSLANAKENTPLHLLFYQDRHAGRAWKKGKETPEAVKAVWELAELFLERGADAYCLNHEEKTPVELALKRPIGEVTGAHVFGSLVERERISRQTASAGAARKPGPRL